MQRINAIIMVGIFTATGKLNGLNTRGRLHEIFNCSTASLVTQLLIIVKQISKKAGLKIGVGIQSTVGNFYKEDLSLK